MTYNVFGGTLNIAQLNSSSSSYYYDVYCTPQWVSVCTGRCVSYHNITSFHIIIYDVVCARRGTSGTLSAKLQSSRPEDFPVSPQLHIYVIPSCSYRVSISIAWTELYGQVCC